jgi:hypothetical protein
MASIGGLDLGYGSQAQIVRTNVLCIALDATGMSSAANAHYVHNTVKEGLKGSMLEPDFTYFYQTDDVTGSGYTQAAADAIFDQDADNDGTAEVTALSVDGLLRDIQQVPLVPGSAHADTTAANEVFGTAHTLHDVGSISGNMMLQSVLSVAGTELADTSMLSGTEAGAAGLFVDDDADTGTPVAASNSDANETSGIFAGLVQGRAMDAQYTNMMAASATGFNRGNLDGSGATGISTGARLGPYTLNLLDALTHLDTGYTSGALVGDVDGARAASDSFGAIMADISGQSCLISSVSIAKVC